MKLPTVCPSCDNTLNVSQMKCPNCKTEVSGDYELPVLLKLNREEQEFVLNFSFPAEALKKWLNRPGFPTRP